MARLGNICEIVSGTTPKSSVPEYWDGEINWITPAELNDDTTIIYESQRKITEKAVRDSNLKSFPEGTVILSSRAPIGKVAIAGVELYCNQGFKNLICSERIHNKYLFWFLKGKTELLNSLGRGATFKVLTPAIEYNQKITITGSGTKLYLNDTLNTLTYTLYSSGINLPGSAASTNNICRYYYFKGTRSNTTSANYNFELIPCINPSGVVGFYDLTNAAFIGPTAGTFIAGPAV